MYLSYTKSCGPESLVLLGTWDLPGSMQDSGSSWNLEMSQLVTVLIDDLVVDTRSIFRLPSSLRVYSGSVMIG